jgi:ParB/RepB/Spo0J family partition protein
MNILIDDIHIDEEFNSRGAIAPIDVIDLQRDIDVNGLLQPIIVSECNSEQQRAWGKKYKLIAGFRRLFCVRSLNRKEIEAVVKPPLSDIAAASMNLRENLLRSNLNILQEAKAIARLRNLGVSETACGAEVGQSRGWAQIRFMLLSLPKEMYPDVVAGIITQTNIRELYSIMRKGGPKAALDFAREMKSAKQRGLKNHEIETKEKKANAKRHRKRPEIFLMQEHVRENFGNNFATRCLAWAAGEISTSELDEDIKKLCTDKGRTFVEMKEDSFEDDEFVEEETETPA